MSGEVRGYVLAGGRSSRMGVDKRGLQLGGKTLLEIAVGKLAGLCAEVTLLGTQEGHRPAGCRVIEDLRAGCGPIGGMAAALRDAGEGRALFLPVDMPLLPQGLLAGLTGSWIGGGRGVCFAMVDGVAQPLVSLVSGRFAGEFVASLERAEYKVRPLLERCGAADGGAEVTALRTDGARSSVSPGWLPGEEDWRLRAMWFANLNTPAEFRAAEEVMAAEPQGR